MFSADNQLIEIREPVNQTGPDLVVRRTQLGLDPSGRKTSELVEEATVSGTDPAGSVTSTVLGRHAGYRYQAAGWLAGEYDATTPAAAITYRHNLDGTLASAVDATAGTPVGVTAAWQLDGHPTSVATTVGGFPLSTVTGAWSPDGERLARSVTTGSEVTSQNWSYNPAGFATASTADLGGGVSETAAFGWNSAGAVTAATYGTVTESRSYLADGTVASTSAAGVTHTYSTDGAGRVASHHVGGTGGTVDRAYTYDPAGRVVDDNGGSPDFEWDPNSNRTAHRGTAALFRADNSVQTVGATNVAFDAAGRRVHPDPAATGCEYRYDFLNRTTGITQTPGATCTTQAAYLHDPLSRQILDLTGDNVQPSDLLGSLTTGTFNLAGAVEQHNVFDLLDDDLAATTSRDTTGPTATNGHSTYAQGPTGPWAIHHQPDTGPGTIQVLLGDGHGNTTTITTPTGGLVCQRLYEPFGNTRPGSTCTTTNTDNQVWYRGGQQDPTTGTYQYGSRHYDPTTATWTTPDMGDPSAGLTDLSIGTDPLTNNRYTYVNGDPINQTDPTGHRPCLDDGCEVFVHPKTHEFDKDHAARVQARRQPARANRAVDQIEKTVHQQCATFAYMYLSQEVLQDNFTLDSGSANFGTAGGCVTALTNTARTVETELALFGMFGNITAAILDPALEGSGAAGIYRCIQDPGINLDCADLLAAIPASRLAKLDKLLDQIPTPNTAARHVIGGMEDLGPGSLRAGKATVASRLPGDAGNRLGNWLNNRDVLRSVMREGQPIRDASVDSAGNLVYQDTRRFITLERDFLRSNGWTYDPPSNLWMPPR